MLHIVTKVTKKQVIEEKKAMRGKNGHDNSQ